MKEKLIAFPALFHHQVQETPDALAVLHEGRELSYLELEQLAKRYAAAVQSLNLSKGDYVGLCLDRSPEAIAAMLGVLQAGAAFVPLDPEYPVDRLAYMINDASVRAIISQPKYQQLLESGLNQVAPNLLEEISWIDTDVDENSTSPDVQVNPDDIAYVMYTSGSTGKPKGVQIQHSALAAYCFADIDAYKVVSSDRTLQFSTLNFDIAIEEIFPPLLTGGSIVVRPSERSAKQNELSDIVKRFDVTAIHLATAYWHEWVDLMVASGERVPESIRLMIVTGEKVCVEHYRRWQQICDHEVLWCNAYGPTEATVSATVFVPDDSFSALNMPIGKPLKRYDAYILDDKLNPVSDGETGQLFIGGPALSAGYLNRPDLTEKAFLDVELAGKSTRLYRTGDLARWLDNGDIDFGGRIDHQIKLGSYRIEPGEIEAALDQHDGVMESLVSYDEVERKKYLIAYVATGANKGNAADLAKFLRDQLPPYMIPSRYVFVPSFPKTINGKIDRQALPNPASGEVPRDADFAAPRSEMEHRLAELFQDVLNVPEVGIHDDFFLLGGSSLLVTQVVARLTGDFKIEIPVRDFFANPTVASAAKHIDSLLGNDSDDQVTESDAALMRQQLPHVHAKYIPSAGHNVFSVRYEPKKNIREHAVLFCPAYGHEYQRSYRNLQQLAVQLCHDGFDTFRFDYACTGNSEGRCADASIELFRQNILAAVEHLRNEVQYQTLSLVGIRVGATLAATTGVPNVNSVVLWDPVVSGQEFLGCLDKLHTHALTSNYHFPVQRKRSELSQLFGHETSVSKNRSFASLRLPSHPQSDAQFILASLDYPHDEPEFNHLLDAWDITPTSDTIHWHDPNYTDSGFSSPHAFREIRRILSGHSN